MTNTINTKRYVVRKILKQLKDNCSDLSSYSLSNKKMNNDIAKAKEDSKLVFKLSNKSKAIKNILKKINSKVDEALMFQNDASRPSQINTANEITDEAVVFIKKAIKEITPRRIFYKKDKFTLKASILTILKQYKHNLCLLKKDPVDAEDDHHIFAVIDEDNHILLMLSNHKLKVLKVFALVSIELDDVKERISRMHGLPSLHLISNDINVPLKPLNKLINNLSNSIKQIN